ncbi:MAG: signal peptidase I [Pseudomonadota bacterium]
MIRKRGFLLAAVLLPGSVQAQDREWWWDAPFKAFTMPSESMEPSVPPGSYLIAKKRIAAQAQRGDIVAIRVDKSIWIKRVVGLPGDRVRIVDGKVILNGKTAGYGQGQLYAFYNGRDKGVEQTELLPGETVPYMVVQLRPTPQDNSFEVLVPANRLYLLGDNRDNSADSRFSHAEGGLETVAFEDVYGVVDPRNIVRGKPVTRVPAKPSPALTPVE